MYRRGLAVVFAISMLITLVAPVMAENNPFPDIPHDHWAYDSVTGLSAAGLVEGYPDGTFGGDRTFTRYEMAQVFARILKRMEIVLSIEIEEKISSKSSSLEQQVADAAGRAQNALTAALLAESKANEANKAAQVSQSSAEEATKLARLSQSSAEEAGKLAKSAYDLADAAKQTSDLLNGKYSDLEAKINKMQPTSTTVVQQTSDQEARSMAEQALSLARQAQELAERAIGMEPTPIPDLSEYRSAVRDASDLASRAAEMAAKAATPEQVAEAKAVAESAKNAAERAEQMAKRAATLEDLAAAMAKAEEAYAKATVADTKASQAQITADEAKRLAEMDKDFVLNEESKKAIHDYVGSLLADKLNNTADGAKTIVEKAVAVPGGLTKAEAEAIASQIVADKMSDILGRLASLEAAQAATRGDLDATKRLLDEKTAALASSVEGLSTEFRSELAQVGVKLDDLSLGLRQVNKRVDDLSAKTDGIGAEVKAQGLSVQKLGSEMQSGFNMLEDKIARNETAISALQKDVAGTKSAVDGLQSDVKTTKTALDDTQSDLASTKVELIGTQGDLAATKDALANLQSDVTATKEALKNTQGDVFATKADLASTQSDLSGTKADLAGTKGDLAATKGDLATTQGDLVTTKGDLAATKGDLATTQGDLAATKGDLAATKGDLAATKGDLAATKGDLAATKGDLAATKGDLAATKGDLAATKGDLAATKTALAGTQVDVEAIKTKLQNTKASLSTELVLTSANPATASPSISLYADPREPLATDATKAAANDWYDNRFFAKDESMLRFVFDVATVPAPGSTLAGKVFVNRPFPGAIAQQVGVGIDMDLTTEGVLRSLHVGEINGDNAALGFSKYVLDPDKWEAQLWRINGAQALLKAGKASANVLTGYGFVKDVNVQDRTGNDLAGDKLGSISAASVQVPLGSALQLRTNWLNLPVAGVNPKSESVAVAAFELFGEKNRLKYGAAVASTDFTSFEPEIGDVYLAQQLGSVQWAADFQARKHGVADTTWTQRLAQPESDGLNYLPDSQLALEISGLKLLDFDMNLAHTATEFNSENRSVWMIRGERDLNILLPLKAVAEIGDNNIVDAASDQRIHTMLDLGVVSWKPGSGKVGIDAGYRLENMPIEADEWAARWRNTSAKNAAAVANDVPAQHLNWGDPKAQRTESHVKATWYMSDAAQLYVGYKGQDNQLNKAPNGSTDVVAGGLALHGTMFGLKTKANFELVDDLVIKYPKMVSSLTMEGGLGGGTISADLNYTIGQGDDKDYGQSGLAKLSLQLPIYEGVTYYLDGRYAGLGQSSNHDYQYSGIMTGVRMSL